MTTSHTKNEVREAPDLLDLFDALFTNARDGVLLSRSDGPILRANPAACAALRRTELEIRQVGRAGLVVPSPQLTQGLAERERTGVAAGELEFRRPDGSTFLAEVTSTVIHSEGGNQYAYVLFRDVTERRQMEKAQADALETARARTAELQALIDAVPAAVYITRDPKSLHMETNLFGAELMRVHKGANVSKTGPAAEAPKSFRAMKDGKELVPEKLPVQVAAARGVEVRDFEFDIVTEDGVTRHLLGNATPLRDMRGQVTGAVGAFVDITERKRMENAVAVSEERLRNLIRSIPIPLAVNDRDRKILSVNDKYTEVLGYTPSDVPDVPTWFEKAYPDPVYRRWVKEAWGAALREAEATGGDVAAQDYRVTAKDGSEHTMEISGVPVGDNFLVTLIDVTERDRAQAAVRDSEEQYRSLVESLRAGVVVHSPDTSIIFSNAWASELLGLSPEQMRGKAAIDAAWRFVRHDGTPMPVEEYPVNRVISTQRPVQDLMLGIDRPKTGDRAWVIVNAYPTFQPPGCLGQVVVTFVDITGEKKAEAERTKLQRKLAEASRLAAMGTLVAGMAHEINNPLAAVMSSAGTAAEDVEELQRVLRDGGGLDRDRLAHRAAEVREMLADVTSSAERIAHMVKDLAIFGGPAQQRRRVRIAETIRRSMGWFPAIVAERAQVHVEAADVPEAMASEGQIEQVLVNLVVNATLAIPDGRRGEIVIRLHPGTPGMVRLEVSDDGQGIPPHLMERIFEPFFTTRPTGKGTGLGLSICHAIVTAHGGTLTVTSEVGKGSTFRVELPAAPAEA